MHFHSISSLQTVQDVDICTCNTDNCNQAVDLGGTRKCHQCSFDEKSLECKTPEDYGKEVTCEGYCAIISYSMFNQRPKYFLCDY